jgi:hypothetical protein
MDAEPRKVTLLRMGDEWKIDNKIVAAKREQVITFSVEGGGQKGEFAYFQFPPGLLMEEPGGSPIEYMELDLSRTNDFKARVVNTEYNLYRNPHYYSIFVKNGYVRGENPPPQIIVGP